ncbi:MAG: hypothetical protein V1929_04250 [bacterium]
MDTPKRAKMILVETERRLRELVGEAAAAGEYDTVERLTDWARTVGLLARYGNNGEPRHPEVDGAGGTRSSDEDVNQRRIAVDGPAAPVAARRVAGVGETASRPARRPKRVPAKGEYPKFLRRGDHLVKIGWSKKEREEYVHKAPRRVVDALAAAIAKRSANGKVFTAEDLFPLKDPQDGSEIPGYQGYVALAWFRSAGLVKQHGRSGYSARNGSHLAGAVATSWEKLSERGA